MRACAYCPSSKPGATNNQNVESLNISAFLSISQCQRREGLRRARPGPLHSLANALWHKRHRRVLPCRGALLRGGGPTFSALGHGGGVVHGYACDCSDRCLVWLVRHLDTYVSNAGFLSPHQE